jgi:hypothetical protein
MVESHGAGLTGSNAVEAQAKEEQLREAYGGHDQEYTRNSQKLKHPVGATKFIVKNT